MIAAVLAGNDALVVMPTGGGKSVCYQLPPLLLRKTCIVVSPLISLMEDQVQALNARCISACFLGSAQSSAKVKEDALAGKYAFVYVTPELAVNQTAALQRLHANAGKRCDCIWVVLHVSGCNCVPLACIVCAKGKI